jgi:ketosteroid isomerase-like protein
MPSRDQWYRLLLLVPFELKNGCSEEGLHVESDNFALTNTIRKHYLVHFGHRDLEALVQEYHPQAVIVHKHNLVFPAEQQQQQQHRSSFHGHDQIRSAFRDIFEIHPTVNSTFHLKEIVVTNNGRTARVVWSATTPTHKFEGGCDTFQFDAHGKIAKQVVMCELEHLKSPWYEMDE